MRLKGLLKSWNESRGFGFITCSLHPNDIFVHVTAFPSNERSPTVGETLTFEVQTDGSGKTQAVQVQRYTLKSASRGGDNKSSKTSPVVGRAVLFVAIIVGSVFFYRNEMPTPPNQSASHSMPLELTEFEYEQFECDGREFCSQMNSREEAEFFIFNCPNTKMDSDKDGIPCENDTRF